jgi:hypothetical protein
MVLPPFHSSGPSGSVPILRLFPRAGKRTGSGVSRCLVFTGPKSAEGFFNQINQFIGDTLGREAQHRYQIIINDPARVAHEVQAGIRQVREFRKVTDDAYYFNWLLKIDPEF